MASTAIYIPDALTGQRITNVVFTNGGGQIEYGVVYDDADNIAFCSSPADPSNAKPSAWMKRCRSVAAAVVSENVENIYRCDLPEGHSSNRHMDIHSEPPTIVAWDSTSRVTLVIA